MPTTIYYPSSQKRCPWGPPWFAFSLVPSILQELPLAASNAPNEALLGPSPKGIKHKTPNLMTFVRLHRSTGHLSSNLVLLDIVGVHLPILPGKWNDNPKTCPFYLMASPLSHDNAPKGRLRTSICCPGKLFLVCRAGLHIWHGLDATNVVMGPKNTRETPEQTTYKSHHKHHLYNTFGCPSHFTGLLLSKLPSCSVDLAALESSFNSNPWQLQQTSKRESERLNMFKHQRTLAL